MPTELETRRNVLTSTRRAIQRRAADDLRFLETAPAWYRLGMDIAKLSETEQPLARELEERHALLELDRAILAEIDRELELLDVDPHRLQRCARQTLTWINGAQSWKDLVEGFRPDPTLEGVPGGRRRRLSEVVAKRILAFRDAQPHHKLTDVRDLLRVEGVDKYLLQDLVYSGCDFRPEPFHPTVGVMLPVRIETRFYADPVSNTTKLRLRVVPDHVSVDRHDPQPTALELDNVERMWQQAEGDLTTDAGKAAWGAFMLLHRPHRAVWLARTFPPLPPDTNGEIYIDRPTQVRQDPRLSCLRGIPPQIEVWLARGSNPPALAATLNVSAAAATLELPEDLEDPAQDQWWNSYVKAEQVGLATEIDLGPSPADDIDVLYVVGVSTERPDTLFRAHRDAGLLAVLAPGEPTNTVDAEPAADLGEDPEYWREMVLKPPIGDAGTEQVSQALTGLINSLGPLPGGTEAPRELNLTLVKGVWPALWGHAFRDVWGLGPPVAPVGVWAGHNLVPEGPVPAIRVGDHPYGILPTTSLARWQSEANDPACEAGLHPQLERLRQIWADAARGHGTVAGAGTEKLLELLGQVPSSEAYAYRLFVSLEYLFVLMGGFDQSISLPDLEAWWQQMMDEEIAFPLNPQRRYLALFWPMDLEIPLVEPDNLPEGMTFKDALLSLVSVDPGQIASGSYAKEFFQDGLPNSLLFRLLMYSLVKSAADVHRANQNDPSPALEPVAAQMGSFTQLQEDAFAFSLIDPSLPESRIYEHVRDAVFQLAQIEPDRIERAFKSVLDTAISRVDPWITATPWRRVQALAPRKPQYRLGWYGWVDNPAPGIPGPTDGGLLHAPSHAQALTAVILRDRAISDPEPNRWAMNLDSRLIRIANRMAKSVRLGMHIQEVLGREVERAVGDPERIKKLRINYPIRVEHAGRQVCNGQAVLVDFLGNPASLGLTSAQLSALAPLAAAVDVYGDLLVSEAVYNVVNGRAEIAAASMDAAAGLVQPPALEVIQTPRGGRSAATTVAFCLPLAPAPPPAPEASPTRLADPAVAAFLEAQTGAANTQIWTWTVRRPNGSTQTTSLADLGLVPCDTAGLSMGILHNLVLASVPGADEVLPDGPGDQAHDRVRRLIALLGSRPAIPADLALGIDQDDSGVAAELQLRYKDLYNTCGALIQQLGQAADDASRQASMLNAVRWGIVPLPDANPTLEDRVNAALTSLSDRLNAAPLPDDMVAAAMDAETIAQAIAELATADGHYAVLGRIDFTALQALTAPPTVFAPETRPAPGDLNPLDIEWLQVVAAVRSKLARLEVYQLEHLVAGLQPPLFAWTNRPGDPWQMNAPVDPGTKQVLSTHLVVLYGPDQVLNGLPVCAVGVVDAWSETVPGTAHATTAAFGFNAPPPARPRLSCLPYHRTKTPTWTMQP